MHVWSSLKGRFRKRAAALSKNPATPASLQDHRFLFYFFSNIALQLHRNFGKNKDKGSANGPQGTLLNPSRTWVCVREILLQTATFQDTYICPLWCQKCRTDSKNVAAKNNLLYRVEVFFCLYTTLIWHVRVQNCDKSIYSKTCAFTMLANYANYSLLVLFRHVAGGYYSTFKKQYHTNSFKIYFIQLCLVFSQ